MNATQAAGLLAFGCASISCFMAVRPRLWQALGWCHAALCAELLLGLRHGLHDRADSALRHAQAYEGRGDWQWILLAGAVGVGVFFGIAIYGRIARGGGRSLTVATLLSLMTLMLFVMEIISLHSVDALLYRQFDGLMVIGWIWLMTGGAVSVCALSSRAGVSSRGPGPRRKKRR